LETYVHQFERMAWICELVCHSRPNLEHVQLNVGEKLAMLMEGDDRGRQVEKVRLIDKKNVTFYSVPQAKRFCQLYGKGEQPMTWA
jgi:hypothetical protein